MCLLNPNLFVSYRGIRCRDTHEERGKGMTEEPQLRDKAQKHKSESDLTKFPAGNTIKLHPRGNTSFLTDSSLDFNFTVAARDFEGPVEYTASSSNTLLPFSDHREW